MVNWFVLSTYITHYTSLPPLLFRFYPFELSPWLHQSRQNAFMIFIRASYYIPKMLFVMFGPSLNILFHQIYLIIYIDLIQLIISNTKVCFILLNLLYPLWLRSNDQCVKTLSRIFILQHTYTDMISSCQEPRWELLL